MPLSTKFFDKHNKNQNRRAKSKQEPVYEYPIEPVSVSEAEDQEEDLEEEEEEQDDYLDEQEILPLDVSDSDEDEGQSHEEESTFWGTREAYYNDDQLSAKKKKVAERLALEEEEEAKRLQQLKASSLKLEDFDEVNDEEEEEEEESFEKLLSNKKENKKQSFKKIKSVHENGNSLLAEHFELNNEEEDLNKKKELSVPEKLQILLKQSPELFQLLEDFKTNISILREKISPILSKVKPEEVPSKGVMFLELKHHLLLSYCLNIGYYLLLITEGKNVKGHPIIDTLVRIHTTLQKFSLVDEKLQHQIDKLVEIATGTPQENIQFAPPKLVSSTDEDKDDIKKNQKKQKKVVDQSSMAALFLEKDSEQAEQITSVGVEKIIKPYEGDQFARVPLAQKDLDRKRKRTLPNTEEFEHLEDFSDLIGLDDAEKEKEKEKELMDSLLKKKSFLQLINASEPSRKKRSVGDEDVPYQMDSDTKNKPFGSRNINIDPEFDIDDDIFEGQKDGKNKKQLKKLDPEEAEIQRNKRKYKSTGIIPDWGRKLREGEKRRITRNIEKNRGLVQKKNTLNKNPRVKHRRKYEKALKRRVGSGIKANPGVQLKPWSGEASGIKTNVIKSISLRQ